MINLFRKVRQSLLAKNSFLKYILYISGEIVLVIAGILIALAINNRNEARKNEEKVVSTLKQIRQELTTDINRSNALIEYYINKDSLISLVFSNTLKSEDYKNRNSGGLFSIIISARDFITLDNGFNNFMRNIDNLPEKYAPLMDDLNMVYVSDKAQIIDMNQRVANMATNTLNKWSETYTWYSSFFLGGISDEVIDFFLHDPFYKNDMLTYKVLGTQNHLPAIQNYRIHAIKSYLAISEVLEIENVYDNTDTKNFLVSNEKLMRLAGNYTLENGLNLVISIEENRVFGQADGQSKFELFPLSPTKFFAKDVVLIVQFNLDQENKVKNLTTSQNSRFNVFNRID